MNWDESERVEKHLRRLGFRETGCVMYGVTYSVYGGNHINDHNRAVCFETWGEYIAWIAEQRYQRQQRQQQQQGAA